MNLKEFFSNKKIKTEELYLGLFLKESEGVVFFISSENDQHKIIALEKFKYSNGWENILEDIDGTIYKLETQTKCAPTKTIFFIYSHLVDHKTKTVKKEYLEKIKNLVKNLELKPLGYIQCHEAICEYLEKREDLPLTAVLVEFDLSSLSVFVYRASRLAYEQNVDRTNNLLEDLLPVFEKIRTQMVIPSQIILYNSSDLDTESGRLVSYRFKDDLFIQMPKVQVIHESELFDSLISAFLSQITSSAQALSRKSSGIENQEEERSKVMGFVIGGDIEEKEMPQEEITKPALKKFELASIVSPVVNYIKSIKLPVISISNSSLLIVGLILICGALFSMEFFFHKAIVTIYFPAKDISKKLKVNAQTSKSLPNSLLIHTATETASFDDSKPATGKREVGEKAKGTVTIYNISDAKSFSKGTEVTSSNSLKFIFDNDVKVASGSADPSSPSSGTAKVTVTAKNIGNESNLSAGSKFSVENQSAAVVIAKNDSAFSGGTKKEIKTVSSRDVDDLKGKVIEKAKETVKKKNDKLIAQLTQLNIKTAALSKEIGEEAEKVEIRSQVAITYFTYNEKELLGLLKPAFIDNTTQDFILSEERIKYQIQKAEKKKDDYSLEIAVTAKLTKDVKVNEILKKIVGHNTANLSNFIKNNYHASSLEFQVSHLLPFLKSFLPLFEKNIDLKVLYQ